MFMCNKIQLVDFYNSSLGGHVFGEEGDTVRERERERERESERKREREERVREKRERERDRERESTRQ
jgi:hypothetical protein